MIISGMSFWIVLIVAGGLALGYFFHRREGAAMRALAKELGDRSHSSVLGGNYISIPSGGVEWRVRVMPGGTSSSGGVARPPQLVLEMVPGLDFEMTVRKRGKLDGLAEAISESPASVGDPLLDRDFVVSCNDRARGISWLIRPGKSEALRSLSAEGFDRLSVGPRSVAISKTNYFEEDLDPAKLQAGLDSFRALARE